jgi:hypothetical protein
LTGRCYDGIHSSTEYSKNSGAESTIEALNVMIELQPYVKNNSFNPIKKVSGIESRQFVFGLFRTGSEEIGLLVDKEHNRLSILKNERLQEFKKCLE